jgi:hypothetical protein
MTKNHTPTANRVTSPIHEPCTACIVGVAKGTLAMASTSAVEHLADSFQGLPDAHVTAKHLAPKSKVRDPGGDGGHLGAAEALRGHARRHQPVILVIAAESAVRSFAKTPSSLDPERRFRLLMRTRHGQVGHLQDQKTLGSRLGSLY